MNFNFNANNIVYVDIISRTIIFKLKNLDVTSFSITYSSIINAKLMLNVFIEKFNLKKTDRENQFVSITN